MRNFKIKIDNLSLSSDGTTAGLNCNLELSNFEDLQSVHTGQTFFTASGRAVTQIVGRESVEFEIKITKLYADVYQLLTNKARANVLAQGSAANLQAVSFPVEIVGVNADESLTFDAVWQPNKPITKQEFIDNNFFDILLRLVKL